MHRGPSKISRKDAMRMVAMVDSGVSVPEVAKKFGISNQAAYAHIDTIRPESLDARNRQAKLRKRERLCGTRWDEAVEEMAKNLASNNWNPRRLHDFSVKWGCSRYTVREIVVEASVKIQSPINPYYLSAIFLDCIESLRRIGDRAERAKKWDSATFAYKAAGGLIATVTKQADKPLELSGQKREMTVADLIAQGWTPPPPEGLPMPLLDDPEKDPEDDG